MSRQEKRNGWNRDGKGHPGNGSGVSVIPEIDRKTIREWYAPDRIGAVKGYRDDAYKNHRKAQSANFRRTYYMAMAGFDFISLKEIILSGKKRQWIKCAEVLFPDISTRTIQRYMETANALDIHELDIMVFCSIGRDRLLRLNSCSNRNSTSILGLLESEGIEVPLNTSDKQHIAQFKLSIDCMVDRKNKERPQRRKKKREVKPDDIDLEEDPPVGKTNHEGYNGEDDDPPKNQQAMPTGRKPRIKSWKELDMTLESGWGFIESAGRLLKHPEQLSGVNHNQYAMREWRRLMNKISDSALSLVALVEQSGQEQESKLYQPIRRIRRSAEGPGTSPSQ